MHITFHPRTATFFFNDTATTEIYTLSLHDALPISRGFTVNLFVEGLNGVRYLALGPGGAVYASLPVAGQIVRLVDANSDGVADAPAQTVLGGLSSPFGIAFRGDTMYFTEQTTVKRLDPGATTPLTLVSSLPSGGHGTRTPVIGPDRSGERRVGEE